MYVPFHELSDQSRLWIYPFDRTLDAAEASAVLEKVQNFLQSWEADGNPIQAGAEIRHHHFLLIAAEESVQKVSCCAYDRLTACIQKLEETFGIELLRRDRIVYRDGTGALCSTAHGADLRAHLQAKDITARTLLADNTLTQKGQLSTSWFLPANQTWIKPFVASH